MGHDIRISLRSLLRAPAFTVTTVLTLALATGTTAAILAVVYGILLKPLPFPDPDRLVAVWPGHFQSNADLLYTREHGEMFEKVAAVAPGWSMSLAGAGEPTRITVARVSGNFFETFGVRPLLGQPFSEDATRPGADNAIVLAYGFWMQRFGGDPGVIGRTVQVDGDPVQIVAVMPKTFDVFGLRSDAYTPLVLDQSTWYHRLSFSLYAARLAPGRSLARANAEYRTLLQRLKSARKYPDRFGEGAAVVDMRTALVGDVSAALLLLAGAVGLILLIAVVNVGTLQLTRASGRAREAAIRSALGASRRRLVRELAVENGLIASGGGVLGILFAHALLPLLVAAIPEDTPRLTEIAIDPAVSALVLTTAIAAGLAVGFIPAIGGRSKIALLLRAGASSESPAPRRLRTLLVAIEVALAVMLTVGAGLMLQTLWRLDRVETGFNPAGVLTLHVQPTGARYRGMSVADYYDRLLERVRALPGVTAAGAVQHLPFSGYSWVTPLDVEGEQRPAGSPPPSVGVRLVTPGYFTAIGQAVLAGRPIERGDATRDDVVVVNEVLASRLFGSPAEALGRKVRSRGSRGPLPWTTIVGVVANVRHTTLTEAPGPEIYSSVQKNSIPAMMLAVRAENEPASLVPVVRQGIWSIDKDVPLSDIETMEAKIGESLAHRRLLRSVLAAFAVLGGLLAGIGIYGVVAYSVAQRRRELGIRLALGAPPATIRSAVFREALLLGAGGLLLGIPAAAVASRLMQTLVFGVSGTDPATYGAIVLATLMLVVAASFLPARRASRVDPVSALKGS